MNLSDFNCSSCINYIEERCYKDKESSPCSGLGCSDGSWIVKMLKWKDKLSNKESCYYTVGWSWASRAILEDKKFEIMKVR